VIELPEHPYFVASQYHPEFKSRPNRPEPLFREFVGAALARARERGTAETVDGELQRLAEPAAEGDPAPRGNW
jgi:CTP synthase